MEERAELRTKGNFMFKFFKIFKEIAFDEFVIIVIPCCVIAYGIGVAVGGRDAKHQIDNEIVMEIKEIQKEIQRKEQSYKLDNVKCVNSYNANNEFMVVCVERQEPSRAQDLAEQYDRLAVRYNDLLKSWGKGKY